MTPGKIPAASVKPRILQVCAVDFTVRHFLLPLMRAQRDWGFEVEVACRHGEFTPRIEAEGFRVHHFEIARSRSPVNFARAWISLRRIIRETRPAAVHLHTPVAALVGRPCARVCGVPLVLYTAHGFYFHDQMHPARRAAHIAMERFAQRFADFLFSQSEEDRATAVRVGICREKNSATILNGIDPERFDAGRFTGEEKSAVLAELGIACGEGPVVCVLGRLVREKGHIEFLDAWERIHSEFPAARALIIGDALAGDHDNFDAEIRRRAARPELGGSVVLPGFRADVPLLLAASDLFVLPSWREGMPRSVIEAMASGLPVVATDIRGCREEVVPGETGLLVPARESDPLAEAILRLLREPDLAARMGRAGRGRARELFDERLVIERQREVYMRCLREKGIVPGEGG